MLKASRPTTSPFVIAALLAALGCMAACARIAGLEDHHLEQPGSDAGPEVAEDAGPDAVAEADAPIEESSTSDVADAPTETDSTDAPEEAQPDAAVQKRTAVIAADSDDAMWMGCNGPSDERLFLESGNRAIFVSADEDDQCAGLRFRLEVPAGAKLISARLTLTRSSGDILPDDTLLLRAWDSSSIAPFDDAHTEPASSHDPAGLLAASVGGWKPGTVDGPVTSPDLSALLQSVVGRTDWATDDQHRHVGILLLPEVMPIRWIGFADSSGAAPAASLTYEWTE